MRAQPPIPSGWVKLGRGEVVKSGDKYWSFAYNMWSPCSTSIGDIVNEAFPLNDELVIREKAASPSPSVVDKLWLNPWD